MDSPLKNQRVAFVGKLEGLTKKEALQMVRDKGGIPVERALGEVDLIVHGADHLPNADPLDLLVDDWKQMVVSGRVEFIHETELWRRLGMVEHHHNVAQLYTPAMLAGILKVPIQNIRRWHRMGLICPTRVVHRLAYFDFEEVRNARQIAGWIASGASLGSIKKQLEELSIQSDGNARSIAQLHIIVEGSRLLLRKEEGLIESNGQLRMDFDSMSDQADEPANRPAVIAVDASRKSMNLESNPFDLTRDEILSAAQQLEDEGRLSDAIEWYRVLLARFGPEAEIHFQLAELLYREGDLGAARERYYAAIEADEDFVEARANLGCVLAETGRLDLAISAFKGALARHDDYPDVHFHLARALDDAQSPDEAEHHWVRFIELAPGSPWREEAEHRLAKSRNESSSVPL